MIDCRTVSPAAGVAASRSPPQEDIYGNVKKLRFTIDLLNQHAVYLGRPPVVLDFGCGNATAVGRYLADGKRLYYGVDIDKPSLDYARRLCEAPNAHFSESVPPDVVFDALVYADVLEHLDRPGDVLAQHVKRLAEDGVVIGSVPNGWGPCEIEKWLIRNLGLYRFARALLHFGRRLVGRPPRPVAAAIPYNSASGHVVFFTLGMLSRMAADAGLVIRRFAHGSFIGADLTGATIFRSQSFVDWNARIADRLPSRLVSTWYFEMVKAGGPLDPGRRMAAGRAGSDAG